MAKKQEIVTRLTADAKGLHGALDTARQKLQGTAAEAKNLKNAITPPQGVDWKGWGMAAGAALGTVVAGISAWVSHYDQMQQQATALNTTAEGLQRLDAAARRCNTSEETMHSAFSRFTQVLASAQKGSAKAEKALNMLGLSAKDLGEGGEAAFLKAAAALDGIAGSSERSAAQMAVFGNNTAAVRDALAECVRNGQSMDGIVPDRTIQAAASLSASFRTIRDTLWNMTATSAVGEWFRDVAEAMEELQQLDAYNSGETFTIGGVKVDRNADTETQMEQFRQGKRAQEEERRRQREAREAARRQEQERAFAAQQQREAEEQMMRERQQAREQVAARKEADEQMRRARLTPEQRYAEDRRAAVHNLRASTGYTMSEQQAEEWARTVYDPQHLPAAKAASYAPPRASQPAQSYAAPLPAPSPSPAPQQTAQMLGAILQAVQALQKNTYIVE